MPFCLLLSVTPQRHLIVARFGCFSLIEVGQLGQCYEWACRATGVFKGMSGSREPCLNKTRLWSIKARPWSATASHGRPCLAMGDHDPLKLEPCQPRPAMVDHSWSQHSQRLAQHSTVKGQPLDGPAGHGWPWLAFGRPLLAINGHGRPGPANGRP